MDRQQEQRQQQRRRRRRRPGGATAAVASPSLLVLLAAAVALLAAGTYWGLVRAPAEQFMGEVQRIMYVHVPTAWSAMAALAAAFAFALGLLFTRRWGFDALLEAALEVGVLLAFLLCVQGSLWARPTWGVWWDWDPRLTTVAVMLFAFLGVLLLRRLVEDPARRAAWSAVATIVSFADVPIVYFSVRWWSSLHQTQSSPDTVDASMLLALRLNAVGMLLLTAGLILARSRLAARRLGRQLAPPPPVAGTEPGAVDGARREAPPLLARRTRGEA